MMGEKKAKDANAGTKLTGRAKKKRIEELRRELRELEAVPRSDWHAGFEALLRIDMHKYGDRVTIHAEYELGTAPPRTDYLILVVDQNLQMEKEIFRSFGRVNLIEYRNPNDALDERMIRKACAYANFYLATAGSDNRVMADEMTISVFRSEKNQRLFRAMEKEGTLSPDENVQGIYHVTGFTDIPFQIVITSELQGEEYAAYRALRSHADEADFRSFVQQATEDAGRDHDTNVREYYRILGDLIANKNPEFSEKIRKEKAMTGGLMEILKDEVDKKVGEAVNEARKESEREKSELIDRSEREKSELVDRAEKEKMAMIRSAMHSFNVTPERAMDALSIPANQRARYMRLLAEQS